jgi:hypothetical protein
LIPGEVDVAATTGITTKEEAIMSNPGVLAKHESKELAKILTEILNRGSPWRQSQSFLGRSMIGHRRGLARLRGRRPFFPNNDRLSLDLSQKIILGRSGLSIGQRRSHYWQDFIATCDLNR